MVLRLVSDLPLVWRTPSSLQFGSDEPVVVLDSGRSISAIAEDPTGELVATDLGRGEVLRLSAPAR